MELDEDDDESDSGRITHVSCSVDESSDEDEIGIDQVSFLLMIRSDHMLI